jgi:hypothetical protein
VTGTSTIPRKASPRRKDMIDEGIELGAAMRSLIPRHRAAVLQLFETGGNRTLALERCGYGNRSNPKWRQNLMFEASRFFADRRIRLAIAEEFGAPEDAFLRRFGPAGVARVEALVAAEAARRRQMEGRIIEAQLEETSSA